MACLRQIKTNQDAPDISHWTIIHVKQSQKVVAETTFGKDTAGDDGQDTKLDWHAMPHIFEQKILHFCPFLILSSQQFGQLHLDLCQT